MNAMKSFILLAVTLLSSNLFSQTVEMDWGQPSGLQKNNWYQKIIGSDKDGFFAIRSEGILSINEENLYLEYFSSTTNSKEATNQVIMPTVGGTPTHYEELYFINSKIILFSSANFGSRKVLYVSYLNIEGTLKNKPKEIGSIPVSNSNLDGFKFQLTSTNKIIISFHNTFAQYNNEPFTFKILNTDLTEEYNATLELPLKDRSFEMLQFDFTKTNDICMLIKAEKPVDKKKAAVAATYDYIMLVYTTKKKEFHPFPITAGKYVPSHVIFGLDNDDNVVVAGFFANKTAKIANEFSGSFFRKINPRILKADVMDAKKSIKLFSKELVAEFSQIRNGKTPVQYYNYFLRDLLFFDNGGFAFVAEQEYRTTTSFIAPSTKQETKIENLYFNDLLITGVTKDGVIDWQKRIPKNQFSTDDNGYYHSTAIFVTANKLRIIYNDHTSNLNNKNAEKTKELKNNPALTPKGQAVMATLYSDGSYEKYTLFKKDDESFVIVPKLIIKLKSRYLTYAQDGKSIKFGSFVFE